MIPNLITVFSTQQSPKPSNSADMITIELPLSEYASVGYMAKRIQMRKNRFLAIQKMAEQKKSVGKARWEALGKSLKDRKDDLRAIVRH